MTGIEYGSVSEHTNGKHVHPFLQREVNGEMGSDLEVSRTHAASEIDETVAYTVNVWAQRMKMFSLIQGVAASLMCFPFFNTMWFANFIGIVAAAHGVQGATLERQDLLVTYERFKSTTRPE